MLPAPPRDRCFPCRSAEKMVDARPLFCYTVKATIWRCIEVVVTRTTRNRFVLNRARGFESHHLRQKRHRHKVGVFLFSGGGGIRTGRRCEAPQAISPAGCCLARGSQRPGMSIVAAVQVGVFLFSGGGGIQQFPFKTFSSASANLASCSFVRFALPFGCFPARRSFLFSYRRSMSASMLSAVYSRPF